MASCANTILRCTPFTQTDSQQAPERSIRLRGTQFISPAAWAGEAAGTRNATAARTTAARLSVKARRLLWRLCTRIELIFDSFLLEAQAAKRARRLRKCTGRKPKAVTRLVESSRGVTLLSSRHRGQGRVVHLTRAV